MKDLDASFSFSVFCASSCCFVGVFGFISDAGFGRSFALRMGAGVVLLECVDLNMKKRERRASEMTRAFLKESMVDGWWPATGSNGRGCRWNDRCSCW